MGSSSSLAIISCRRRSLGKPVSHAAALTALAVPGCHSSSDTHSGWCQAFADTLTGWCPAIADTLLVWCQASADTRSHVAALVQGRLAVTGALAAAIVLDGCGCQATVADTLWQREKRKLNPSAALAGPALKAGRGRGRAVTRCPPRRSA